MENDKSKVVDKLTEIYNELNSIDIEEINHRISKIKVELENTIKACKEMDEEKETILLNEIEKEKKTRTAISPRRKEITKNKVIEKSRGRLFDVKDYFLFGIELLLFVILIITTILLCSRNM